MHATARDGALLALARGGHGPPLVLIHGTAADHTRWAPVLPALEASFTVHALDRRGSGASGDGPGYTLEREFEDVATVVDAIGEPLALVGHSLGAICSLEGALRTKGVRKLVLYEPPIIQAGGASSAPGPVDRLQALLDEGDRAAVVTAFLQDIVGMPLSEVARLRALPSWPARVAAAHTIPRELRASAAYRFDAARFREMGTPTLLLLGGESPAFFKTAIGLVHQALPTSRVAVLPGQQHAAMNTAPELFVREVMGFLGEQVQQFPGLPQSDV